MSVAGKAVGDPTAARAFQPVSQVNPTTGAPSGSASTTDGSMPVSGADGTSKSSLTNPVATLAEGRYNATPAVLTEGAYNPIQLNQRGGVRASLYDITGTNGVSVNAVNTGGVSLNTLSLCTLGFQHGWNGASWDQQWTNVAPNANVNVTALLLKSSQGQFFGGSMIAGATAGFFILYNSNNIPSGGAALTAAATLLAVPVAANGYATLGGDAVAKRCTTGVVLLFSTSLTTYTVPANAAAHMSGSAG